MKLFKNEWISPYLKKYKGQLILAILLGLVTLLCAGLLMFTSGYVISKSATKPENILMIYVPVLFVRIFGISRPVVKYIERLTSHNWILRITSHLRKKLYLRLETGATSLIKRRKLGDLLGILNEDLANIQDLYLRTLFPVFIAGTLSIALILTAGVFSVGLAFGLALILATLYLLIPFLSVKIASRSDRRLKKYRNQLFSDLTDDVLGLQDWVLSGRQADFLKSYQVAQEAVRGEQGRLFQISRLRNLGLQAVFGLLVFYLMFWAGGALQSGDTPNFIVAVVLSAFPLFDAYSPLSDALVETNRYGDSVQRLTDLAPEERIEKTRDAKGSEISLSALHFTFDGEERPVFQNLNLIIPPGQHVAILGRSGVGKSTLASLIRGDLTPGSGQVKIGGQEAWHIKHMEELVGVIDQAPYLFNTSIRNNLGLANLSKRDDQIWQALDVVGLTQMVKALPRGLDTMVDEAGLRFSGGERHRFALARIFLADTPIVILDESTLGLDPITENQVLSKAFEILKDKTIILITHHLLGVSRMDRVLFLEKGKIKIDGDPKILKAINPFYKQLLSLEFNP